MVLNCCRKIFRSFRETGIFSEKGKEQGKNRVSIKGVTYEGILKVCDEDKFKELLVTGIGRGKAYGMGLLTIVHV
ncbi:MAG: type I-E CRISPR-associated protein Cas6/Cse3/CasE [Enterocloster sp.]